MFIASLAATRHTHAGAIGIARETGSTAFEPLGPLVDADGFNNELERPHVIRHDSRCYLFWSTQRSQFADRHRAGQTGLYGAVADDVLGPYALLNETGLVLANPGHEPMQCYSWQVLADLRVTSFVDLWGLEGRDTANDTALRRRQFGGTPAPVVRLALEGQHCRLIS